MTDLNDLYQEMILDHSRNPHNFHPMPGATQRAEGYNPLCGDQVTVYVRLAEDKIEDISFEGKGCAISKSSASLMTDAVKGKTRAEAQSLFNRFHEMVTRGASAAQEGDKLSVFSGVSAFPTRIKCAVLAWHTLRSALEPKRKGPVSTE